MSVGVLRLIIAVGLGFSLAAAIGFITNSYILGIPNLIYELLGVGAFGFICGYQKYSIMICLALIGTAIAIILDPAIWTIMRGSAAPFDIKIFSATLNIWLFLIFIMLYAVGGIIKHKGG